MKKEKIVKPDGRWMYLYTFEEEPSSGEASQKGKEPQSDARAVKSEA